jgi:carboxymethylenebutenolidase
MGEMIRFTRPDGKDCPGYLATPENASGAPGVVVIQEWWGQNPQIKTTADKLAEAGFRALVPDLYRGKVAASRAEASHMMSSLNFVDAGEQDVRGAVKYLKADSGKVAVMGFCMGGALTIIGAVKVPEMDAGACFYGIPPAAVADPGKISIPMIFHFANKDDWCTPQAVDGLEATLAASNSAHAIHRYEAEHAFMNEARPEVYDAAAAKLAWDRTLEFFKKTIG